MKIIKWENVKLRIARDAYTRTFSAYNTDSCSVAMIETVLGNHMDWRKELKELANRIYERITKWDVRMAHKLIKLFPNYFPKSKKLTTIEMDEKGDWILIFS